MLRKNGATGTNWPQREKNRCWRIGQETASGPTKHHPHDARVSVSSSHDQVGAALRSVGADCLTCVAYGRTAANDLGFDALPA